MKNFLHIALVAFVSLSLVHCSSDEGKNTSSSLTVNGSQFKLGDNNGTIYNILKSKTDLSVWLQLKEKDGDHRLISVYAFHEPGSANGTYMLRNDQIQSGIATPALYNSENHQIAGGSNDSQPTGSISITEMANNRYKITFNNVSLDPGTASETTIEGTCDKTFKAASGN